jgi:hypothetical protein
MIALLVVVVGAVSEVFGQTKGTLRQVGEMARSIMRKKDHPASKHF